MTGSGALVAVVTLAVVTMAKDDSVTGEVVVSACVLEIEVTGGSDSGLVGAAVVVLVANVVETGIGLLDASEVNGVDLVETDVTSDVADRSVVGTGLVVVVVVVVDAVVVDVVVEGTVVWGTVIDVVDMGVVTSGLPVVVVLVDTMTTTGFSPMTRVLLVVNFSISSSSKSMEPLLFGMKCDVTKLGFSNVST